jgi:hypothetical protein
MKVDATSSIVTNSVCHVMAFLKIYRSKTNSVIKTIDKSKQPAAKIPHSFAIFSVNLMNLSAIKKNTPA